MNAYFGTLLGLSPIGISFGITGSSYLIGANLSAIIGFMSLIIAILNFSYFHSIQEVRS